MHMEREGEISFSSYKTDLARLESHSYDLITLNYFLEGLFPNLTLGEASTFKFWGGHNSVHSTNHVGFDMLARDFKL